MSETDDRLDRIEAMCEAIINHLGMDALTAYVKQHGPIGAHKPITAEQLRQLEAAGFRVQVKP